METNCADCFSRLVYNRYCLYKCCHIDCDYSLLYFTVNVGQVAMGRFARGLNSVWVSQESGRVDLTVNGERIFWRQTEVHKEMNVTAWIISLPLFIDER